MTKFNDKVDNFVKQVESEYKKGNHEKIEVYIKIDENKSSITKEIVKKDDTKKTF